MSHAPVCGQQARKGKMKKSVRCLDIGTMRKASEGSDSRYDDNIVVI
jgi:hypothetical protein